MNSQELSEKFPNFTKPNSKGSLFLSFEGIEGSGKSTQIKKLAEYLEAKGKKTIVLREPGGTLFGEKLREAILTSKQPIAPISEAYLFASARAQLLTEKILPHLEQENSAVLLDRYIDSSLSYQGHARGLGIEEILKIHHVSPLNILPHKTFYLAIDPETSLKRQQERGNEKDYFESEKAQFTKKLVEGFELCQKTFPERIQIIQGNASIDEVFTNIINEIEL